MKNYLVKFLILCSSLVTIGGCNKKEEAPSFVVNTLSEGDNYKIKEFTEAYGRFLEENKIHYENDVTVDAFNIMPHDIFDTYGVGLFKITINLNDEDKAEQAYLYYNKTIYNVYRQSTREEKSGTISVAFTDVNKDGSYEVTTACNSEDLRKMSNLTTFDTMTLQTIGCPLYNVEIHFEKHDDVIGLYGTKYLGDEEKEEHFDDIRLYPRKYELSKPKYELECENYKVKITWSKSQKTNVPVDYFGLNHDFVINTELTYLGEDIELGTPALAFGTQIYFEKDKEDIGHVRYDVLDTDESVTIKKGQVIKSNVTIRDTTYDDGCQMTPIGTYDMNVNFYKSGEIIVKNALIVK